MNRAKNPFFANFGIYGIAKNTGLGKSVKICLAYFSLLPLKFIQCVPQSDPPEWIAYRFNWVMGGEQNEGFDFFFGSGPIFS